MGRPQSTNPKKIVMYSFQPLLDQYWIIIIDSIIIEYIIIEYIIIDYIIKDYIRVDYHFYCSVQWPLDAACGRGSFTWKADDWSQFWMFGWHRRW